MAITKENAEVYFRSDNHTKSQKWSSFNDTEKTAAIAQARRDITMMMDITLDDNEDDYIEGDFIRNDYAVYEQALFSLQNTVSPNEEGSGPQYEQTEPDARMISPIARRWLGLTPQLTISRA